MTNNSITQTVKKLSVKWLALCCLLIMGTWGHAQQVAPATPVIAAEAMGTAAAPATVLTRCGAGTLAFSVNAPATLTNAQDVALFTVGTYPPAAPPITGAITQGWGYDFNAAGDVTFAAGVSTTGLPALIAGSANGPTTIGVRSSGGTGAQLLTAGTIEGSTSLQLHDQDATTGDLRFAFSNFASGPQFYFRTRFRLATASNLLTANAPQFGIFLGNTSDPGFSVASSTLPTSGVFAPVYFNANGAASATYFLSRAPSAAATAGGYSNVALNTGTNYQLEIYGNRGTVRYYYNRGGNVYYVEPNTYDLWLDGVLYTVGAAQGGDDVAATNNVDVNAIVFTNLANANDERLFVDDVRFISTIANAQHISTATCTGAGCNVAIATPSVTANTTFLLASVTRQAVGSLGWASSAATTQAVTVNAVPAAPTLTTPVNICGPSGPPPTHSPVTFTVALSAGANSIALGNAARTSFDESGTAATNIGDEAGWTATLAGTTVSASYIGATAGANNGLEAGETTTLQAYAVAVNPMLSANSTPLLNVVNGGAGGNAARLRFINEDAAGIVYPGCASTAVPIVINANEIPANLIAANLDATAPALPQIKVDASVIYDRLARCGAGSVTYTVDLSTAALTLVPGTAVTGVVELYADPVGGTALATSTAITNLKTAAPTNTATIISPALTAGQFATYYLQYRRTDFVPGCVSSARLAVQAASIVEPAAPTVTATLINNAAMTCFTGTLQHTVNLSAVQGATPASHYRFYGVDNAVTAGDNTALDINGAPIGIPAFTGALGGATPTNITINPTLFPFPGGGTDFTPGEVRNYRVEGVNKLVMGVNGAPFTTDMAVGCTSATRNTWTVTASPLKPAGPSITGDVNRCGDGIITLTVATGLPGTQTSVRFADAITGTDPTATLTGGNVFATVTAAPYTTNRNVAGAQTIYADYVFPNSANAAQPCTSFASPARAITRTVIPSAVVATGAASIEIVRNCAAGTLDFRRFAAAVQVAPTNTDGIYLYTVPTGGALLATLPLTIYTSNPRVATSVTPVANVTSYYVYGGMAMTGASSAVCLSTTPRLIPLTATNLVVTQPTGVVSTVPCGTGSNIVFKGTVSQGASVYVKLYTLSAGGTAVATTTAANFVNNTTTTGLLTPATTTITSYYIATLDSTAPGNVCESARTLATVAVGTSPTNPTVTTSTITECRTAIAGQAISVPLTLTGTITQLDLVASNSLTAATVGASVMMAPFTFNIATTGGSLWPDGTTAVFGTAKNFWIRTINQTCTSQTLLPITITINEAPANPTVANTNQTICGSTTVTFAATMGTFTAGYSARLYTVATGGTAVATYTIMNPSANTPAFTHTVTTTNSFWIAQLNPNTGCENATRQPAGTVTVGTSVSTPTISGPTFCGTLTGTAAFATSPQLTFSVSGVPTTGGTFRVRLFTQNTDASIITADVAGAFDQLGQTFWNPTNNTLSYSIPNGTLITTTTTYYIAIERFDLAPSCFSTRSQAVATFQTAPAPPTATNVTVCITANVTLTVTASGAIPSNGGVRIFDGPTGVAQPMGAGSVTTDVTSPYELVVGNLAAGTTTYWLETFVNNAAGSAQPSCSSSTRTSVVVTRNANPANITAAGVSSGTTDLTCDNNNNTVTVAPAAGGVTAGNIVRLYNAQTGGSPISTALTPTTTINGDNLYILGINTPVTANTVFYVAQANPFTGCESQTRTPVTVLLKAAPAAPAAVEVARCGQGILTFTATAVPGIEVRLYNVSTGGVALVTDNVSPYEVATGTITQTTTFFLSSWNGTCESTRIPVVARINDIPGRPALLQAARRCGPGQVMIPIELASVANNSEVRLYLNGNSNLNENSRSAAGLPLGTPISQDNTPPFELMTGTITATTSYHIATINTLTGCESDRLAIPAIIEGIPGQPFVNEVFRCGTGSVVFTVTRGANASTSSDIVRLYTVAMGGTPVTSSATAGDAASTISVTTPILMTTTTFYVAVFNSLSTSSDVNSCEGPRRMVVANVNPGPDQPTIAAVSRCGSGKAVLSVFMGNTPGTEVRLWKSEASVATADLLATVPTNLGGNSQVLVETPTFTTTTTFWVEVRNPGLFNCSSTSRVSVVATVNENPAAPTVTPTAIQACGPGNVQVAANLTLPINELRVYNVATGGTFISNDVRVTGPWVVTAPVMMTGNLYVAARNTTTGCESENRTLVTVVVGNQVRPSAPVVTTTSTTLLCGSGNAVINAAMGAVAGTSVRLYTVPAGGTSLQEVTAAPYQFTVSPTQRTTYYLSANNSVTGCESDRTEFVVNTGSNLNAPQIATTSASRCGTGVVTFSANATTLGTAADQIRLYTMMMGGTPVSTISPVQLGGVVQFLIATPQTTTTTTYYIGAYESTTGCESNQRTALTLTINPTPEAPTSPNVGRCSFGPVTFTVTMGNPAGTEARLYTVASGSTPIVSRLSAPFELTTQTLGNGTVNYFISAVNALGCESPRVAVRAVVTQGVNQPMLSSSSTIGCGAGSSTMQFALGSQTASLISGTGIYLYTIQTGGTAVLTAGMAPYTIQSPIVNTTTTFWASAFDQISGCESARIQAIANVVPSIPSAPMVSDITQCVAGAGTFVFTVMPGTISGDEVRLYTMATGGLPVTTDTDAPFIFDVSGVSTTSNYYFAIGAGAGCESARTAARAIVNSLPSAPLIGGAQRCSAGAITFNANMGGIPGARIVLYDAPIGGNMIDQDNTSPYTLRATVNATTNFWAAVETDQCVSNRVQVTGSVTQPPLLHNFVSNNIAVCPGSRGTFIGNLNGYGNELRMYNAPVGGNIVAIANPIISNTTPFPLETPALSNSTQFFVSAFDNVTGCETARIPVSATVGNPATPQLADMTVSRCGTGRVEFSATLPQPSGTSLRLYSQAAGGAAIATDMEAPYMVMTPSLSSPRTMFYVAVGAGTCESDRVAVMANVLSGPSSPTASDVSRCGAGQVTFSVNMGPIAGTYVRLYDAEMGGNLIDQDNFADYLLTSSFVTTNTDFYIAVGNQTCETNRIRVRALVGGQPGVPAPVASQVSICGQGRVTFVLNQNLTAPGTAMRLYTEANGGLPVAVSQGPVFALQSPVLNSTQSFFAAAVLGNCESDRVQLTAVSTQAPSAPLVNNVTRCGVGPVVFTAAPGTVAGTEFRLYPSADAPIAIAVDNTAPYELSTPPLTTSATFFVSSVTGSCESIRVSVTAVLGNALSSPSATGVTICGSGIPVFGVVNNPSGGSEIRLYANPMGGTPIATTDRAPFTLTGTPIATTTTFYVASATGSCESPRVPVVANVLLGSTPSAPTAAPITRCGVGSVMITAFMGSNPGQTIRLWTAPQGGQLIAEAAQGPTYLLNVAQVNNSVTYYASATTGQCESPRTPVAITIVTTAPTPSVNNVAICGGQSLSTVFTANFGGAQNVEARLYTVPFGGAPIAIDPSAPYELGTPVLQFTTTFFVAGAVGTCEGNRVPVTAAITQTPGAPTAANVTICNTNTAMITAMMGAIPGSQVRLYTQAAGGNALAAATAAPYTLTVSNVFTQTTYYISSALAGNCESNRTPVVVSLGNGPAIAAAVTNESCLSLGSIAVTVTPAGQYSYLLNTNVVGTPTATGSDFTNLTAGTYTITVSTAGGCQSQTTATISQPSAPTQLSVSNIIATTATVSWGPVVNAISYTLEWRVAGSNSAYQSINLLGTVTSHTLSSLQVGTTYEVRISTTCSNRRVSSYAGTTFTTVSQSGSGSCSTPTNVVGIASGPSRATISWTPNVSGAVCYIVSYGPADNPENTWNQFLVQHPTSSIAVDVQPGIRYGTRVRTNCTTCGLRTGTITAASAIAFFTVGARLSEIVSTPAMEVSVYPNPNNGNFNIGFNANDAGDVNVNVVDLNGRTVYTSTFEAVEGENEFAVTLDHVASGIYFVNFRQGVNVAKMKIRVN